ncbi:MAG: DUF3151 family protein [Actinomycetota bacterium]
MSEWVQLPRLRPEIDALLEGAQDTATIYEVVGRDPLCLEAWARLADMTYEAGDDVASYAFARVGYHRGLDLLRSTGWRPDVQVGWAAETNRGFLRSLYALMRAAAAIGEGVEARRCREFLVQLDPSDHFGVGTIAPKDLSRRLPD